jgi:uncharacterized protein YndB with AHSA1/START domain
VSTRSVVHDTITVERLLIGVKPPVVFEAWADPVLRSQWDNPGDDFVVTEQTQDFRVGGRQTSRFGPPGDPRYWSDGLFLDIVPYRRIVSAGTMHEGDMATSVTLFTVELVAEGDDTRLVLTDQSAFLDTRETPADRRSGWRTIADRLARFLSTSGGPTRTESAWKG